MHTALQHLIRIATVFVLPFGLSGQGIFYTDCSDKTVCFPFNQCGNTNTIFVGSATTTCGSPIINFTYKVDFGNNGSIDLQAAGDTINASFPPGASKITWRATNSCGQAATCTQIVTLTDCQSPNLICRNGITQSLDNNCTLSINAQQYVLSVSDNCTPTADLEYGLRRAGTGTGFPPYDTLNYATCDLGTNIVEVYVRDAKGNINQCANYVLVQNNSGNCECIDESNITLKGCARRSDNVKLNNYRLNAKLQGTYGGQPLITQKTINVTDSCFTLKLEHLPLFLNATVTLSGSRIEDITTGVTPYDLVLISRHILNLEPLTSFYQTLAADVNRSQTITTFDIVEIRKTLLGLIDTFPKVPIWQFVRPVPDPSDLIAFQHLRDTFRLTYNNLMGDTVSSGLNFIGIKSADIDRTAAFTSEETEDRNGEPMVLMATNQLVAEGAIVDIPIVLTQPAHLSAWQSSFFINPEWAELISVQGIAPENFAVLPGGEIRIVWMPEAMGASQFFEKNTPLVVFKIRIKAPGQLANMIEAIPIEAVTADVHKHALFFRFAENNVLNTTPIQVFAPIPNPFSDFVEWPLTVTNATSGQIILFDSAGRLVSSQSFEALPGFQSIRIDSANFPDNGWYFWRLIVGEFACSGKLFKP